MKKKLIIIIASLLLGLTGCKTQPVESEIEFLLNAGYDTVEINTTWINPGAYLKVDEKEYDALSNGTINTSIIGLYRIEYTYTYEEINYMLVRYVNVVDQTIPIITIESGIDTIVVGNTWSDAGASVTDNSGEVLIITTIGSVNTSIIGTYEITYSSTDSSGNTATEIRYVNVIQ